MEFLVNYVLFPLLVGVAGALWAMLRKEQGEMKKKVESAVSRDEFVGALHKLRDEIRDMLRAYRESDGEAQKRIFDVQDKALALLEAHSYQLTSLDKALALLDQKVKYDYDSRKQAADGVRQQGVGPA